MFKMFMGPFSYRDLASAFEDTSWRAKEERNQNRVHGGKHD